MIRCRLCLYPDTKPDLAFVDGVCSACRNYAARPEIDWEARKAELCRILDEYSPGGSYDCVVPSSGGKDSHYQVLTLIELGARPLVVTASTCHLTRVGRYNIDNLARHATTIEVTPNRTVRAKLNRLGLELVGDISWPEHAAIFSIPFYMAGELGIPLIFYGENPQREYGGPLGAEQAAQMTARWRSEFGGFLGLRPIDFVGREGITERDMADYELRVLSAAELYHGEIEPTAFFLGQFIPWDSHENAHIAAEGGMFWQTPPCSANWWKHENLDNAQTGIHDHFMYRKYGYGRGVAQISVDIRSGRITREKALAWAKHNDGKFPQSYEGVLAAEVVDAIGLSWGAFLDLLDQHTNWEIFEKTDDPLNPKLKEGCWQ